MNEILPANMLVGMRVGVSVSGTPDLGRLGHAESHLRRTLGAVTRQVFVAGGTLAYGGHLESTGYTNFLASELERYGAGGRPLLVCLPWSEHRSLTLSELRKRAALVPWTVVYLSLDGTEMSASDGRGEEAVPESDPTVRRIGLTAMRRYVAGRTNGQVLIGGKRDGFSGEIPGTMEEALIALESRNPLYLAAGFGGATLDIVRALGVDDCEWFPPFDGERPTNPRFDNGLERLRSVARSESWKGLNNGLTDEQNRRLAASYRPDEVAALVSLGLGRVRADSRNR